MYVSINQSINQSNIYYYFNEIAKFDLFFFFKIFCFCKLFFSVSLSLSPRPLAFSEIGQTSY